MFSQIKTPQEALKRGGHKHPDQIVEDLNRGYFAILSIDELIEYQVYKRLYEIESKKKNET